MVPLLRIEENFVDQLLPKRMPSFLGAWPLFGAVAGWERVFNRREVGLDVDGPATTAATIPSSRM
jgi:hypothetical protein